MTEKDKEIINNGYVKQEYRHNAIHKFCAVVKDAMQEYKEYNWTIDESYDFVRKDLSGFSYGRTEERGIKPIERFEDILSYLFNPQNEIPAYLFYWIDFCYGYKYASVSDYTDRHYDIYDTLQRKYIEHYRWCKESEKQLFQMEKERKRLICQLYKSDKYPIAFKLYGSQLKDIFDFNELQNIYELLVHLFSVDFSEISEYDIAAAYLIGVMQGEENAKAA